TLSPVRARGKFFPLVITNQTTGAFTLTLNDNVLHDPVANGGGNTENNASVVIPYQMHDVDNDLSLLAGQLTVTFDDDMPSASPVLSSVTAASVDESAPVAAAVIDTLTVVKGD